MVGAGLMSGIAEILADHFGLENGIDSNFDPELLYQTIEKVLINGFMKR